MPKLGTGLTRPPRFAPRHPPLERGRDLRLKPAASQHVVAVGRRPDTVHRLLVRVRLEQRPVGFAPPVLSWAKLRGLIVRSDQPVAPPISVGVAAVDLGAGAGREAYGEPPPPGGGWYRTFCGT